MPGKSPLSSYCTDHAWKGRADCVHCSIRGMMLFSPLPQASFAHLLHPVDNMRYAPGSLLYTEGERGRHVFSIRRGLVKLLCQGADGSQRIVRLLGKGAVVGLELLDQGASYHHSAVAVQEVDLCAIPVSTLKDLERQHPELCDKVRQQLQFQVDRADHWIKQLNTGMTRDRIGQLLLLLKELGADPNGDIELLPRDDMAAVVGVTKETASRVIADFKRQGLLYKVAANKFRVEVGKLRDLLGRESSPD